LTYDWDWSAVERAFERALTLNPGSALVLHRASNLYLTLGPPEKAIELNRRAVELDPLDPTAYYDLAASYYFAGRLGEAEAAVNKMLELAPDSAEARASLGAFYLEQKRFQESVAELEKVPESYAVRLCLLAMAYHAVGRQKEATAALSELIKNHQSDRPAWIACVYAQWGQADAAFEWLERAYQQRDWGVTNMKFHPLLKPIADDPRFHALLKKMKLQ
jgi:adenylate cyclase